MSNSRDFEKSIRRSFGSAADAAFAITRDHGNVNEIIGTFSGADQLRTADNQLQSLLYAA